MNDAYFDDEEVVVYHDPRDVRDLNMPENFINRSPKERAQAAIYFLRAGAVEPFRQRMAFVRQAEPDFVLDLSTEDFTNACLWKASLAGINFRRSRFAWADLSYADLRGTDFSGANMIGAEMRKANLTNANLSGADLRGADLTGAIMTGANLEGAQQGELPPEMLSDNPNYQRVEERKRIIRARAEAAAGSSDGVSGATYSAPKRDYSGGAGAAGGKKGPDPGALAKAAKEEAMEKRKNLQKGNLKKFQEKKSSEKRFQAKKAADNKKFAEKKKQDQAAWDRKNKK